MTRSKKARNKSGAARKGSPYELRHDFRVGDKILVVYVPSNLKNITSPRDDDMRTADLSHSCVGRRFLIRSFGRYGHIELHPGDDKTIREQYGRFHSIWIEPEHLQLIRKSRAIPAAKRGNGTGWKADLYAEQQRLKAKS
jgi:hypothetical protein